MLAVGAFGLWSWHSRASRRGTGDASPAELVTYLLIQTLFFFGFRAAPTAYGGSQARGPTRAAAAGLHHSHSHARSELCL